MFSLAQTIPFCQSAFELVKTAEKYHYDPRPVDDKFSELVFSEFIKLLDPYGLIFTSNEVGQLEISKIKIDEEILNQECSFVKDVTELYKSKLSFIDSLVNGFQDKEFDFNRIDTLIIKKQDVYVPNEQFIEKWKKWVKYQFLSSYLLSTDSMNALLKLSPDRMAKIQEEVLIRERCRIKTKMNYTGGIEQYVGSKFLKAVSFAFDPHTNYFTSGEKNALENMLSKGTFSYGFELSRNELGEIEIYQITPGSPAWNSNAINEGDVILDVKTNKGIAKDFNCLSMREAINFIASDENDEASFHIRKENGKEFFVMLNKEKISVKENIIKSFILEGEQKIGYIYLPSFYINVDDLAYIPNGCANDVAKELIVLQREGINGLIIDLRNNGGGSMLEAIRLAGIFINYGALGIIHSREEDPITIKDIDRGTIYYDPMVILINSFSASASELFAAAMQDHNRAIIAGTNSFGKSTAQEVLSNDAYKYDQSRKMKASSEGYLKLTLSMFYRVTGKSLQMEGVIPDIKLPDIYDHVDVGESTYKSALATSTIEKKTYYFPFDPFPIKELQHRSELRVNSDSAFILIKDMSLKLSKHQSQYAVPLKYESFKEFYDSTNFEEIDEIETNKAVFSVKNPSYIEAIINMTGSKNMINENAMLDIKKDIYINETFQVINDLIELSNK